MVGKLFNLALVGNYGIGKSSLLSRYNTDIYPSISSYTCSYDFKIKRMDIDGNIIKLQIWDTSGQERLRTISSSYYKNIDGVIVMYDVTDSESFDHVETWLLEVSKFAPGCVRVLVGNKCDDINHRSVTFKTGKEYAVNIVVPFFETSAKLTINTTEVFLTIAKQIYEAKTLQNDKKDEKEEQITQKKEKCFLQ